MVIILKDWFSLVSKIDSPKSIIELVGMEKFDWIECPGQNFYLLGIKCGNIRIFFNGRRDGMGVMLCMSGQGCREFEQYGNGNWEKLFSLAQDRENYHLTRLDLARDDKDGVLDMPKIWREAEKGHFVSRFEQPDLRKNKKGLSVVHGSRSSEMLIRIYDKAKERGYTDGRHWVRFEISMKNELALAFIKEQGTIGEKFYGVVDNYLRYVEPNENDTNKRRWKKAEWWVQFIEDTRKIKLYTPCTTEYNLHKMESYIDNQLGNTLYTYAKIKGIEALKKIIEKHEHTLNEKQKHLINISTDLRPETEPEHKEPDEDMFIPNFIIRPRPRGGHQPLNFSQTKPNTQKPKTYIINRKLIQTTNLIFERHNF